MFEKAAGRFDLGTQGRICALCPNMCRFLCPVAAVEKLETVSPRGKATLRVEVERGGVEWTAGTAEVFYHCAGCRVCREWCPSDVDLPEVTASLRERAAREGVAPEAARAVARRLVHDRSLHRPAAELAAGLVRYRELLSPGAKVLYFAGCQTAALHPEVVGAALRLFEAAGVKVAMLEGEECCGLPLWVLGFRDEAAAFAGRLAAAVEAGGYETVVSGCPMCTYMMKERYPALGAVLGAEVRHVTEFFSGRLAGEGAPAGPAGRNGRTSGRAPDSGDLGAETVTVTYHDPCYLGRYQGVYDAPRRLLVEVAGLELVEMDSSRELAACCGGSPVTDVVVPGTATSIAGRRVDEARRTGATTLVTACPHCLDMLAPAAGLDVRDIAEVLAAGIAVRCGGTVMGVERP